jgi:hypothetical protein
MARSTRSIIAAAGAFLLAAAFFVASAPSASAADQDGYCNIDEWCGYRAIDFAGGIWDTHYAVGNFMGFTYVKGCSSGCGVNDTVSSMKNQDDVYSVRVYDYAWGAGFP